LQNDVKEEHAAQLIVTNMELEQFAFVASHDLQHPLRTVSNYMHLFEEEYRETLDDKARQYIESINSATKRMQMLIKSLLDFSRLGHNKKLVYTDSKKLIEEVIADLDTTIKTSKASIQISDMPQ